MTSPLAGQIADRLREDATRLEAEFQSGPLGVRSCVIDDLLPVQAIEDLQALAPNPASMLRRADYRERKYVTADLNQLNPRIQELVLAFASPAVAEAVSDVTDQPGLQHDLELYNGGLTTMAPSDFMLPHLDNSHDKSRKRRRAVVMLFYLSAWKPEYGGSLCLWDERRRNRVKEIEYRRNRCVLLETTDSSWHSVEPITGPVNRVNVTTYFYDVKRNQPVRLTRYSSWPERPLERARTDADFFVRSAALKMGLQRFAKNAHIYKGAQEQKQAG